MSSTMFVVTHLLFESLPILIVVWTVWEWFQFRNLKRTLAAGEREALSREYRLIIAGEVLFGALSVFAVGTKIMAASPSYRVSLPPALDAAIPGALVGMAVALVVGPILARRGVKTVQVGDFAMLLPRTLSERKLFVLVAINAGVCEELIFRGYGMRFFESVGLTGFSLLIVAALAFGLVHIYQGVLGVAGTFVLGLVFGLVYVKTGSLLIPMILHALIDLRVLALPARE